MKNRQAVCAVSLLLFSSPLFVGAIESDAADNQEVPSADIILLEREGCPGCPTYKLSMDSKGQVAYEGMTNVALLGSHSWKVVPNSHDLLVATLEELAFSELLSCYGPSVSDMNASFLTFRGKRVMVSYDFGSNVYENITPKAEYAEAQALWVFCLFFESCAELPARDRPRVYKATEDD